MPDRDSAVSFCGCMSASPQVLALRSDAPAILPSLLLCDFGNLEREIRRLEEAGARALHLDVMDGHFVPNLTYGLPLVEAIRKLTALPLDAHLMIDNPIEFAPQFVDAGADSITIHIEACPEPGHLLVDLRRRGAAVGLALNPPTPLARIEPYLDRCDLVLVMSVMPGFGGQAFDPVALDKLAALANRAPEGPLREVDGGINDDTAARCAAAGAELLVVGSAIFRHDDYSSRLARLGELARSGLRRPAAVAR